MSSPAKRAKTSETETQLDQLKRMTTIVADTGEFQQLEAFRPQDATTNPSLIFKAAQLPAYAAMVDDAISFAKAKGGSQEAMVSAPPLHALT